MNINDLEKVLSEKRLSTYYNLFPTDKEKAIEYYRLNIQISESFYPLLSNLEILLRNSIHNSFSIHYKSADWFSQFKQPELFDQVNIAKRKILTGQNLMTTDKVIAELTFGFWTSLFNKQYAKDFWKPLMYAFPLLDIANKRRDKIAYKLNHIRKFRNRIFHYEPISNDLTALATNHNNILEILNWINADIVSWTKQIDRFDNLYKKAVALRSAI
ncbi:MAG: hypothetical protein ABIY35_08085 [Chitinophagaceae bacterium]